jgi:hypothetical protein
MLLATAIVEMAQPRYFFPVWPLFWTIMVVVIFAAGSTLRHRHDLPMAKQ